MGAIFWSTVFVFGFLSMGFQLLAARMLGPWFGSSIVVWAFLISTFLSAFTVGSFLGAHISKKQSSLKWAVTVMSVGMAFFAVNVFWSRTILDQFSMAFESVPLGLLCSCASLFFPPVLALSTLGPIAVEWITTQSGGKLSSGVAAGCVMGTSTAGNILGVMATALLLIPKFGITSLLVTWILASGLSFALFSYLIWVQRKRH